MTKLTIIGAGSTEFTKRIVTDLLLMDEFKSISLALMDINKERLDITEKVINSVSNRLGANPKIKKYTNRKESLVGADFVQTTIQVGGYRPSTIIDFEIPKKFGLQQTIADTLGIGGIMRGLRTIPVLEEICSDIKNVCPKAIWLQYVNPMAINMIAINRIAPEITSVGLCHSVQGTAEMLAKDLEEKIEDIRYDCAGINHLAFYTKFEKIHSDGSVENLYPRLNLLADQILNGSKKSSREPENHGKTLSEKVRYEMLKKLGYFVTESSEHFAEYVPWFIKKNRKDLINKFDIPIDEYLRRCEEAEKYWENNEEILNEKNFLSFDFSKEYSANIIRSVYNDKPIVINGNVPNKNFLIPQLPKEACVEVPCKIDSKGIFPQPVKKLPSHLTSLMQTNINVQLLTVEAFLNKKKEYVYHAAMLDPHTASALTLDEIWKLVDELIEAHGNYIPKLN